MDTLMMWRLIGAFINVTVLSRAAAWALRRWVTAAYKRAVLVFGLVLIIDFIGAWSLYDDPLTASYIMLFYYVPFLLMWSFKDILDAAREGRKASDSAD